MKDIEREERLKMDFRLAFNRDMTAEEKKLLLWAETVAPSAPPDEDESDSQAAKVG